MLAMKGNQFPVRTAMPVKAYGMPAAGSHKPCVERLEILRGHNKRTAFFLLL